MSVGTFLFFQLSTMTIVMAWYSKRHPHDAMQLFMRFRGLFTRRS